MSRADINKKNIVVLFKGKPYKDDDPKAKLIVPLIPLSLISLASPLRDAGYNVKIIDQMAPVESIFVSMEDLWERVICVGISALTGNEITEGINFAKLIKKRHPSIPIVWGGWHVSILPEESIKNQYVDIIVKGLGQEVFLELVNSISYDGLMKNIPRICYKSGDKIINNDVSKSSKLDKCPLPAFDMLDLEYYRKQSLSLRHKPVINNLEITGYLYFVTSFGCPNECAYCCSKAVFGKRLYNYDIEKVVDQIKWLVEEKNFNSIGFIDANFFININRVKNFCNLLIEKKIRFVWDAQMHVRDIIRYEREGVWELIKKSGCFKVNIGSESGSQDVLDYIRKYIRVDDILESARILNKYGIEAAYNFLFGLPKVESKKHIYESFDLAKRLKNINPEISLPISFYVPFPGTNMYRDAIKMGLQVPDNLEAWGMFDTNYSTACRNFSWESVKRQQLILDVLTFYIPLAIPGNVHRGTLRMVQKKMTESKLRFFIKIGNYLARLRLEYSFYYMPFEIYIFKIYRFLTQNSTYVPGGKIENE